jgi:hypothetical protein
MFTRLLEVKRQMAAADPVAGTSTNKIVDSLPVSVCLSVRLKKKMKGREEGEMLKQVYRPLGSSLETDRR